MAPVLRIEDLSVEYCTREGTVPAARHVGFDMEPGQVTALVGESGAGKTTVALSILRLIPEPGVVTSGAIRLRTPEGERDLATLREAELRDIRGDVVSMIFQDPVAGLNPVLEIGQQVQEAITSHRAVSRKDARDLAMEALTRMRLPDPKRIARSFPGELSGGMCQRVMIAIATVLNPKVLIADEPTSSLDVTVQAQIINELNLLREQRGTSILLITHDMGVVAQIADVMGVMYAGALVEMGDTVETFRSPRHPYTWSLLETLPRLDGRSRGRMLPQIRGAPADLMALTGQCSFLERCPKALTICREESEPPIELLPSTGGAIPSAVPVPGSTAVPHSVACYNPVEAKTD